MSISSGSKYSRRSQQYISCSDLLRAVLIMIPYNLALEAIKLVAINQILYHGCNPVLSMSTPPNSWHGRNVCLHLWTSGRGTVTGYELKDCPPLWVRWLWDHPGTTTIYLNLKLVTWAQWWERLVGLERRSPRERTHQWTYFCREWEKWKQQGCWIKEGNQPYILLSTYQNHA